MKKLKYLISCFVFVLLLFSTTAVAKSKNNDIVILYTNDIHCSIDDNIGYAGLSAYRKKMLKQTPYVTLVDCGDAIQGDLMGTVSQGGYIVDIMNEVGYDYAILGNHEFDYGMKQLSNLVDRAKFSYLGCNITYTGTGKNSLNDVKPYAIKKYGKHTVAFIGVSTPYSITNSTPKYFMNDKGKLVYDFYDKSDTSFYSCVQKYVDTCKKEGADYVVLLTHLGDSEEYSPFSSLELIHNTNGVDVVLDGHAHSMICSNVEKNKDGKDVILSSTGKKLKTIGQLIITNDGMISTGLITGYQKKDTKMKGFLSNIKKIYGKEMNEVVATSDTALSCTDENGIRLVRNRETTIGNFCADAYRTISGADIAFVNGGGIRANLSDGNITYADVLAVHPYGNSLCEVEATGQEIIDALEFGSRKVTSDYSDGYNAVGENGGFLQVSGLQYSINTAIKPSITTDENGLFVSVDGPYRVNDVKVQNPDGSYSPIDPDKKYTVASHSYMIKNCGDGYSMFANHPLLIDEGMADYDILTTYIKDNLKGQLSSYSKTEGRIQIINE